MNPVVIDGHTVNMLSAGVIRNEGGTTDFVVRPYFRTSFFYS